MSPSTPAAGAGTSIVTLSVSSSTKGSSTATASPVFLNHLPMVASVTDSPSVGTRISAMTDPLYSPGHARVCAGHPDQSSTACQLERDGRDKPGHDDSLRQRLVQKMLELGKMQRHLPDRGRCRGRPAGIAGAAMLGADLIEHPFQEDIDEHPAAHIARLFLTPDDLGILEARQFRHQRLGRERIELFDAQE